MKNKTAGNRGPRWAAALAVMAAAVLATGCGVRFNPSAARPAQAGPVTVAQELALAQCMRGHGVPSFPNPAAAGGFRVNASLLSSAAVLTAYGACRHLLAGGGPSIAQLQQDAQKQQQAQQRALPALVKFTQCMRGHGVPGFPDPPAPGQSPPAAPKGDGISPGSPLFQAAVAACQHVLPAGAHLSFGTPVSSGTPQP